MKTLLFVSVAVRQLQFVSGHGNDACIRFADSLYAMTARPAMFAHRDLAVSSTKGLPALFGIHFVYDWTPCIDATMYLCEVVYLRRTSRASTDDVYQAQDIWRKNAEAGGRATTPSAGCRSLSQVTRRKYGPESKACA